MRTSNYALFVAFLLVLFSAIGLALAPTTSFGQDVNYTQNCSVCDICPYNPFESYQDCIQGEGDPNYCADIAYCNCAGNAFARECLES